MRNDKLRLLLKEEIRKILNENLSNNFNIGDTVKVNNREGFKELIGLQGKVVGKNIKKGVLYIDFGKEITGDGFATYDLSGLIPTNTGLGFFDRGWISSKIDPRFDIRNLTKINNQSSLNENDIIPIGPDGEAIADPTVAAKLSKNLKQALVKVPSSMRSRLTDMIADDGIRSALKSKDQRASILTAIAIAFGVNDQEFGQVVSQIKKNLAMADTEAPQGTEQGMAEKTI